ncbi:MAG TPA: AI-2E family transporter [Gaiellaceae bacterium]|nr:AI-2E family transporter [Gaiellaceae bacterium]
MSAYRVVDLRPRTILRVLLIVLAVGIVLEVVWISRHVLSWVVISLFLALALDPLVGWIERRTGLGRGSAIAIAYLLVLIVIVGVGATFVPKLIDEVNGFVQALPNYVHDLTHGRGRLGFLERKYHIVEKVREQVKDGGAKRLLGLSGAALSVTKSVITIVAATVTIVFLTFFMLLEGRDWMERIYSLLPERSRPRWRRVGHDIYRTVGGYVTGNILISLIAGASITVVLLIMGVPYAVALGLVVAFLDLIPLAGATIAGVIVAIVAFLHSIPAGIVVVSFFVVYQQIENHFLQPVIYGRTVQLSPLAVLISVLVGAELAGILGALAAIPVAGALQVIVRDQLAARRGVVLPPETAVTEAAPRPEPG